MEVHQALLMQAYIAQDAAQGRWLFLILLHHLNFVAQDRLGVSQQDHEAFFRGL
jgi:hypothetical protein